jgi:hypothetical protein
MEEKSNLEELKEDYQKIKDQYNLPDFDKLNEDFQIEKISDNETDFLTREIRKYLADKFSNYLRFIEMILHPVNSPMFIFSMVKSINTDEKDNLTEIYKKLAKIEVELIELDIEYHEENEANFIKKSFEIWQDIKKDLLKIIGSVKNNWDNKSQVNGRKYFD